MRMRRTSNETCPRIHWSSSRVNLFLLALIVIAAASAGVALMFVIRRRAREDHFFVEVERGAGVFAFLGTAFAVLLAFVVLEAFGSFNDARTGAESEATALVELSRNSEFFSRADREPFAGRLICYARAVIDDEWPAMRDGERSEVVQSWVEGLGRAFRQFEVRRPTQEAAFLQLLEQEANRVEGRRARLSEATRDLPAPVWFILALGAALTIGFAFLFADRRESFLVQGGLVAAIVSLVTAGLLLVWFLDHPYADDAGSIRPTEMERQLEVVEHEQRNVVPPCNSVGERETVPSPAALTEPTHGVLHSTRLPPVRLEAVVRAPAGGS
jgi:hypothetical protein